jgi:hypothetical protein
MLHVGGTALVLANILPGGRRGPSVRGGDPRRSIRVVLSRARCCTSVLYGRHTPATISKPGGPVASPSPEFASLALGKNRLSTSGNGPAAAWALGSAFNSPT